MKNSIFGATSLMGLLIISTAPGAHAVALANTVIVNGITYTTSGPAASGVVDFLHNTPDFTFTASGNVFLGLNNAHTNSTGSADAYFNKPSGTANADIGVILNSSGGPVALSTFRTSPLPVYDSVSGNYGYDSTHTNGAIYKFFTGISSGTVSLVSLIAGQANTGGNANVYAQSVNSPASAAPEPSQWAAIAFTGLAVGGLIVRKRRQVIA